VVSVSELSIAGEFEIDPGLFDEDRLPRWEESFFRLEISGHGLRSGGGFEAGGTVLERIDGDGTRILFGTGLNFAAGPALENGPSSDSRSIPFRASASFSGGDSLSVIPVAGVTRVTMASSWEAPGFSGRYLPVSRSWGSDGFTAEWDILSLNHGIPRSTVLDNLTAPDYLHEAFGVNLVTPVDAYQKSLRTVEYAALFLIIPFVFFLFMEVFGGNRVHPVQYLLAGFADVIFYLLLISFSEHLGFNAAFILAAAMAVFLLGLYSRSIFAASRFSWLMFPLLSLAYGFLFWIIRSEDYALLLGSLLLFIILAAIMMATRKIDWYALGRRGGGGSEELPVDAQRDMV
jgi:inner membrane protein